MQQFCSKALSRILASWEGLTVLSKEALVGQIISLCTLTSTFGQD